MYEKWCVTQLGSMVKPRSGTDVLSSILSAYGTFKASIRIGIGTYQVYKYEIRIFFSKKTR